MHTFAIAVAKPGRRVGATVRSILTAPSPGVLPFVPEGHLAWSDRSNSIAFGGWQAGTDALALGSHWDEHVGGLVAFAGHPLRIGGAWSTGESWARQLSDLTRGRSAEDAIGLLEGVYAMTRLTSAGHGWVVSDPLGMAVLYRAENEDITVISTRAGLAARLVTPPDREPERDAEALASLAYASYMIGDQTGYADVHALPQGSCIVISARGAETRIWAEMPWLPDRPTGPAEFSGVVESVRVSLASTIRTTASLEAPVRTMELTGGKDSRLILSLLLSENLADQYTFITWGAEGIPDWNIATEIADRFELHHKANGRSGIRTGKRPDRPTHGSRVRRPERPTPPKGPPATHEQQVRNHLFATEGMLNIWDLRKPAHGFPPRLALSGLCREGLRTNYPRLVGLPSMNVLYDAVRGNGFLYDPAAIMTPDARRRLDDRVIAKLERLKPPGGGPQDAIDGYFLGGRLRRWFGTIQEHDRRNRLFPLYSMPGIRAAFSLGAERRAGEALTFELIRSMSEELALIPIAADTWSEIAYQHRPDADRFRSAHPPKPAPKLDLAPQRLTRQAPSRHPDSRTPLQTPVRAARNEDLDQKLTLLRGYVDLPPDHEFFDWFDRREIHRALDTYRDLPVLGQRGLHGAASAALWLTGQEQQFGSDV